MNTKAIKSLAAVSIEDAEKVGTVSRAFFDPATMGIVGFVIDYGRGAESMPMVVTPEAVRSLGPDALMFDDKTAFTGQLSADQFDHLVDVDRMGKHKVVTEGGTFVGQVASFEFDETTFALQQVEVSPGFFKSNKHVSLDQIVSISAELIIVDDAVATDGAAGSGGPGMVTTDGRPQFQRVVETTS